jgi:hypothetical protein
MPQAFDPNDCLIQVPSSYMGGNGLNSIKATFRRTSIDVVDSQLSPDDYLPVGAIRIYTDACGVPCDDYKLFPNTALSRASFWMGKLEQNEDGSPPPIQFQIRQATGPVSEIVYTGTYKANLFGTQGLIAEISGYLCEQFEFWARVPDTLPFVRHSMMVTVSVVVDRLPAAGLLQPNGAFLKKGIFTV